MSISSPISTEIEIPESLYNAVISFTEASHRDYNDVMQVALEMFLATETSKATLESRKT